MSRSPFLTKLGVLLGLLVCQISLGFGQVSGQPNSGRSQSQPDTELGLNLGQVPNLDPVWQSFIMADSTWDGWPKNQTRNDTVPITLSKLYKDYTLTLVGQILNDEVVGAARYYINHEIGGITNQAGSLWHGEVKLFFSKAEAGDTGVVAFEGKYIGGELEEIAKWYYPFGKLAIVAGYENDLLDGNYQSYHPDGAKQEVGQYLIGKPAGLWQYYAPNGRLCLEEQFDSIGRLSKVIKVNTDKGQALDAGNFSSGNGRLNRYTFAGQLKAEEEYRGGLFEGLITLYDSTKRIKETSQYLTGERNGVQSIYWSGPDGGRLHERISWQSSSKSGRYDAWHPDGKQAVVGYYYKGVQDSIWQFYHVNGRQAARQTYQNMILNGKQYAWYPNGQVKSVLKYEDGELDSLSKFWYSNGKPERQEEYAVGIPIGTWSKFYTDGQPSEEQDYIDGKRDGMLKTWYLHGKQQLEITWAEGKRQGKSLTWYPNGQQESIGYFRQDLRDGKWEFFHPNGRPRNTDTYINGLLDRTSTVLDASGHTLSNYTVVYGTGRKQNFYPNGTMATDGQYQGGKLQGAFTLFSEVGKVIRTERYINGELVK